MDNGRLVILEVRVNKRRYPSRTSGRTMREYDSSPRAYFNLETVPGETVYEQLFNRRNRPHLAYAEVLRDALAQAGVSCGKDYKARWSQKAGCTMCPCSPGFILNDAAYGDVWNRFDVWVTVCWPGEEEAVRAKLANKEAEQEEKVAAQMGLLSNGLGI